MSVRCPRGTQSPNEKDIITEDKSVTERNRRMKKLFTLSKILGVVAIVYMIAACQATSTANSNAIGTSQKEMLLSQAGFVPKTVTTPKQQQQVNQLPENMVSAVKYHGKLYYVFPTAKKNQIFVGKQAQYNAYKKMLQTQKSTASTTRAAQTNAQGEQQLGGTPFLVGETAGPHHIMVEQFDGFGPMEDSSWP
jgi:hypothetical protein